MKELILKANTEITENNLPDFAKELRNVLSTVNTDLKTDEDFATAKDLVKKFDKSEKALKAAKERIFESGELSKINSLINELSAECRDVRLTLNRTVTTKEKEVKDDLVTVAAATINKAFNNSVMYAYLTVEWSDIADQIKGKKLLSKMEEALNTYVGVKINAIQIEETSLLTKLKLIEALTKGNETLFNTQFLMNDDDYENTIKSCIQANDEAVAEKAKVEAERLMEQERQAKIESDRKIEQQKQAEAKVLEQKTKEPVQSEVGSVFNPNDSVHQYEEPEPKHISQQQVSSPRSFNQTTEPLNHVTKHNNSSLPSIDVNRYRIRLDVTCCIDEAKSIATELKIDYSRLVADVSLNQVSNTKVA